MLTRRHLATVAAATLAVAAVAPPFARANSDEATITANIEAFRKAMLAQDKAVLEGLVTDKLVYGHSDGRLENTAEFIAAVMARKARMTKLEYSDIKVNVAGSNATAPTARRPRPGSA